jgi:transitional endoplasmic reticulum ATPase
VISPGPVRGEAARPAPARPVDGAAIEVSRVLLDQLGGGPDDLVRVRSYSGREVFTRAADPGPDDLPLVRLGRMLWSQLGVKPGDTLELSVEAAVPEALEVVVRPAFHLSHHLGDHVIDSLRKDGVVVWPGARVFAPIFAGGGGVVLLIDSVDSSPAVIGGHTRLEFAEPDPQIAQRRASFAEVGGLDATLAALRDLIELPLLRPGLYRSLGVRATKGVILHGPPGTGKTLLSRAVAEELRANVITIPATELVGTYSGETEANMRSLFNEAAHHAPTLIVIDELDVVATSRNRLASQSDVRATTQLLSLMDGLEQVDGVVVLATTNRVDVLDEALRRPGRFDEELYVGPPDAEARREILAVHSREMPLTRAAEAALRTAADDATSGFTGADLMHLTREAGLAAARRLTRGGIGSGIELAASAEHAELSVSAEDIEAALRHVGPSAMRGLPEIDVTIPWDDFDGLDELRAKLAAVARAALRPAGRNAEGVLLTGPSGNGKSALVQALGRWLKANVVPVDGSTIFTQWLGESEAAIRTLFARAGDLRPSIVVVEHLDSVAPRRRGAQAENAGGRVLSALLSSVDQAVAGGGVLVVGVTDRPELIDPALIRAGRLGMHLQVPDPDDDRRRLILSRASGGQLAGADLDAEVARTDGASAAEVDRLARRLRH